MHQRINAIFAASLGLLIVGCATREVVEIPPTASGDELPTGALLWELWTDVDDPSASANWYEVLAQQPAVSRFVPAADLASMPDEQFVGRLSGQFVAPENGDYVFAISGEQAGALYFASLSDSKKMELIASFSGPTGRKAWNKFPSQVSKKYSLSSGQRAAIDAFVWDRSGYDYIAIAWSRVNEDGSLGSFQVLGSNTVSPRIETRDPDAEIDSYKSGYRVGYTDGRYSFPYEPVFPFKDADGDGLPDNWESAHGLNPNDASDALVDHDADGMYALLEFMHGFNPIKTDTDGDGLPDGWEYTRGLNALDSSDALSVDPVTGLTFAAIYSAETGPKYVLRFTWEPVLVREDGTPISEGEIATLVVKYGFSADNLDRVYEMSSPKAGAVDIPISELGAYYVSLMVKDINGIVSEASPAVEVAAQELK